MANTMFTSGRRCMLVAVAMLGLVGCQRSADSLADGAIERASGGQVKVERDGDTVTVATADGQSIVRSGESLSLPEAFPGDVYLPDGYAINSVMDLEGVNVLNLRAPGKLSGLFADAREAMAGHGWKETLAMQHSVDSAMLAFEKGERNAMLAFSNGGDQGVSLSVQLSAGKQTQ